MSRRGYGPLYGICPVCKKFRAVNKHGKIYSHWIKWREECEGSKQEPYHGEFYEMEFRLVKPETKGVKT